VTPQHYPGLQLLSAIELACCGSSNTLPDF